MCSLLPVQSFQHSFDWLCFGRFHRLHSGRAGTQRRNGRRHLFRRRFLVAVQPVRHYPGSPRKQKGILHSPPAVIQLVAVARAPPQVHIAKAAPHHTAQKGVVRALPRQNRKKSSSFCSFCSIESRTACTPRSRVLTRVSSSLSRACSSNCSIRS